MKRRVSAFSVGVWCLFLFFISPVMVYAQFPEKGKVTFTVCDSVSGQPLEFANVFMSCAKGQQGMMTDRNGRCTMPFLRGRKYRVRISYIGYDEIYRDISFRKDTNCTFVLNPTRILMSQVVVTAAESQRLASASRIDRKAMEHLQPSSFTDITALLPGGVTADPQSSRVNSLRLREAGGESRGVEGYDAGALGVSFVIDGIPMQTDACLQYESNSWEDNDGRNATGKGVDMRGLSTDDIASVEIVRGIPSVEYGELTSGLVRVTRKKGGNHLDARFKADMQSRLFYVGKGFEFPKRDLTVNLGLDYLDAKDDPRNHSENYKRVTASLRTEKTWTENRFAGRLSVSLDYSGMFERDNQDPDLTQNGNINVWESDEHRLAGKGTFVMNAREESLFRQLEVSVAATAEKDLLHREKTVSTERIYAVPVNAVGPHDAVWLPPLYEAEMDIKGLPVYLFAKSTATFGRQWGRVDNRLKIGADWKMDKNYGAGQLFDPTRPITPGNISRPRAFRDIPAGQTLSFFLEETSTAAVGRSRMEIRTGLRGMTLMNLDRRYALHGKVCLDPRLNLQWRFPSIGIDGRPLSFTLSGGVGMHTKMPVMAYLYPDKYYVDFVQLNYFHNNPDYRRLNVMTYEVDKTNYALKAARNLKWEIRGNVAYAGHALSVTYFRERMNDGFRNGSTFRIYDYRKYDTDGVDHSALTAPPDISLLPYTEEKVIDRISYTTNGSRMKKEGIEFQYSSPRFPLLYTRLTVNGAWFRTLYANSMMNYHRPNVIIDNAAIKYIGIYRDDDGSLRESFNTNFIADTDLPRLKMGFSATVQCIWFTASKANRESGVPDYYVGTDGQIRPYTEESRRDAVLQHLVETYSDQAFDRRTVPFEMAVNFKATKKIWKDKFQLALFVNRLLNYSPDYTRYNRTVRRSANPYFGMELNVKL